MNNFAGNAVWIVLCFAIAWMVTYAVAHLVAGFRARTLLDYLKANKQERFHEIMEFGRDTRFWKRPPARYCVFRYAQSGKDDDDAVACGYKAAYKKVARLQTILALILIAGLMLEFLYFALRNVGVKI